MGWTDDEIDNLAKNASANQKVEYNDIYWKEMEALLDAEKPAKKRLGWWFFGATISLLIIGTGFYYMVNKNVEQEITILAYDAADIEKKRETNTILEKKDDSFIPKPEQIVRDQINSSSATETNVLIQKIVSLPAVTKSDLTTLKNRTIIAVAFEESNDEETTEQNDRINEKVELAVFADNDDVLSDFETGAKFQAEAQQTNEENTEISKPESLENDKAKNMTEDPMLQKKIGFYVAAGAGAGTSYIKTSDELLIQWKVRMGIDYTILNQFRVGAGVGFRQQLLNKLTAERSREYYSLGLIDVNQTINYDRLQFIDLNFHAHYLFRKISVGIELTPSYLVGVRANMKQTQIEYDNSFVDEVTTTRLDKQFVRSNNFNSFGLDAGISFQYQFKYRMSLDAGVSTRFNKMLMTNEFRGEYNRFPVKLELGLIKRF